MMRHALSSGGLQVLPLRRRLARDRSGVATVEFAFVVPLLVLLGMGGAELANVTMAEMKVSEIALSVADNASRLGQTDNSAVAPTISEDDVDSVMQGASDAGEGIGLAQHGRVILSSLEKDKTTGKQYIHWQRCFGDGKQTSRYGDEKTNNGLHLGQLKGMGRTGKLVTAPSTTQAVMYVEVYYSYQSLFGSLFGNMLTGGSAISKDAAFLVRDDRDLSTGLTGVIATSNGNASNNAQGHAYGYGKVHATAC